MDYLITVANNIKSVISQTESSSNSVIVYDIDNTLINDYGYPIIPIIDTYLFAISRGFKVVIMTARPGTPENIDRTKKQLHHHGIFGSLCMYFLPPDKQDPARYKLLARKDIHDKGYKVVMSIGDMPWDMGEYGGIGVQVPVF
jgi:predicted secreted acid phosphatase